MASFPSNLFLWTDHWWALFSATATLFPVRRSDGLANRCLAEAPGLLDMEVNNVKVLDLLDGKNRVRSMNSLLAVCTMQALEGI